MSSPKRLIATAATALLLAVMPVHAATEIGLASAVPPLTAWANALAEMTSTWTKDTEGRVTTRLYLNGSQGSEKAVLTKMRPGVETIQATFITAGGLASQDKAFNVFNIPFFFEND